MLLENAYLIRNLYHVATADTGSFNFSYRGFQEWLKVYVIFWTTPYDQNREGIAQLKRHINEQVVIALTQPTSEIGVAIRLMEYAYGPTVYWDYLIGPATLEVFLTPTQSRGARSEYQRLHSNYQIDLVAKPESTPDFGTYLADLDMTRYFRQSSGSQSTPSPIRTPTPRPSTQSPPTEGAILYNTPLIEWFTGLHGNGWFDVVDGTFRIGVFGAGEQRTTGAWTGRSDFGDISASLDVRAINSEPDSAACISIRHDANLGDYSLCISGNGTTRATYDYADAQGVWHSTMLLADARRSGTNPATEWNTLRIIAKGDRFWFVVNGQVIGSAEHNARRSGSVALYAINWDAHDVEFEFANLIVRSTQ